jgi:HD-GYP domain-containing protein (c-di-GMP phosphodiesterase class II)
MIADKTSSHPRYLPATVVTDFVTAFHRLLGGASIYDRKNPVMDRLAQTCLGVVNGILQSEGHLFLKIAGDHFFFNNVRIHAEGGQYSLRKAFMREIRKRRIGEIEFTGELTLDQLKEFITLFSGLEESDEGNYFYLKKQLADRDIGNINVGRLDRSLVFSGDFSGDFSEDEEVHLDSERWKRYSKEIYFRLIHLGKEIAEDLDDQRPLQIRKAKRLIQNAVNSLIWDESTFMELATIKNYDETAFNHSVNVALYSIVIGQRIGVPRKGLAHLGLAGLFHDIGKMKIPKEILKKTGTLSPEEWDILCTHALAGAETVMRAKEWDDLSARMMEGAFEHHLKYDLTGYPKLARIKRLSLFGRIIALSDVYDALASSRGRDRFPYVSEKIPGIMLERIGKDFDPVLTKVFINTIGVFPLGTLVLLDTREMGVVTHVQEDAERIDRPGINLLCYSGGEYRKGKALDLWEIDEKTGGFKWNIIKTLNPNEYNINVAEYFI